MESNDHEWLSIRRGSFIRVMVSTRLVGFIIPAAIRNQPGIGTTYCGRWDRNVPLPEKIIDYSGNSVRIWHMFRTPPEDLQPLWRRAYHIYLCGFLDTSINAGRIGPERGSIFLQLENGLPVHIHPVSRHSVVPICVDRMVM